MCSRTTRAGRRCTTSRGCVRTPSRLSARVYWDDEYVERTMALETVSLLGNCRPWITNEYEHGGYRVDPARVADRLFSLLDDLTARK